MRGAGRVKKKFFFLNPEVLTVILFSTRIASAKWVRDLLVDLKQDDAFKYLSGTSQEPDLEEDCHSFLPLLPPS